MKAEPPNPLASGALALQCLTKSVAGQPLRLPPEGVTRPNHFATQQRFLETEGRPLFLTDWDRVVFIHYQINARVLQSHVPFLLDLHDGDAYISLVAFTQSRLRPFLGGSALAWMGDLAANHEFLNVRTYVSHDGEAGIYFLAEWVPNLLATWIAPRMYGFPYRFGRLDYHYDSENMAEKPKNVMLSVNEASPREMLTRDSSSAFGRFRMTPKGILDFQTPSERDELFRETHAWHKTFACEIKVHSIEPFQPCAHRSLDEFLMERYTAFTQRGRKQRFFRIWHEPWRQVPIDVTIENNGLLASNWAWFENAQLVGAHYSPGVTGVWIGRPHTIRSERRFHHAADS